jgi:hypothetical protein
MQHPESLFSNPNNAAINRPHHTRITQTKMKTTEVGFLLIVVVVASCARRHGQTAVVSCMKGFFFHASIHF